MTRGIPPAGPSQRQLRVGEAVRHALADILARTELDDPALRGRILTVPEVRMSPDLRLATVYVVPLGGGGEAAVTEALRRHARFLKGEVARRLSSMRVTPELRFRADETFDAVARVDRLLSQVKAAPHAPPGPAETDAGEALGPRDTGGGSP